MTIERGTLKFWNDLKGYGFITPLDGSTDIFCGSMALRGPEPEQGAEVEFEAESGPRGPRAKWWRSVASHHAPEAT